MIFFFYGPNTYMAHRKLTDMAEAYVTKSGSDFGLERIDGSEANADKVIGALQASPFLANSRLVIVTDLGKNKVASEKVLANIDNVPDSTVAVFYDREIDQRTAYFKGLSKHSKVKVVKYEALSHSQLAGWVKKEMEKLGGSIDSAALRKLLESVGEDQWRLSQELQKLVNYNTQVTAEHVDLLVEQSNSESIFDLVEAMSSGNLGRALKIFQQLLDARMNEVYILTMVTWQLRNLLLAKTAGNISSGELAKRAGMSPYVAGKAQAKGRNISQSVLTGAFYEAIQTDFAIKTGKGKPDQLVEQLIYRVATGMKEQS